VGTPPALCWWMKAPLRTCLLRLNVLANNRLRDMPNRCVVRSTRPQSATPEFAPFQFWESVEDVNSRNRLQRLSNLNRCGCVVSLYENVDMIGHDFNLL